jgi:hypothetical protein
MRENDTAVVQGSEFPDYLTPYPLAGALCEELHVEIDLAADAASSVVEPYLGPGSDIAEDALQAPWHAIGPVGIGMPYRTGFLNPPWSRERKMPIEPWLKKAVHEAACGFTTVMVVPHRPDTRWWRLTQHAVEIREIPHRVKYLLPPAAFDARNRLRLANGKKALKGKLISDGGRDAIETSGAGFPTAIVVFRPQPGIIGPALPRRVLWDYLSRTRRPA